MYSSGISPEVLRLWMQLCIYGNRTICCEIRISYYRTLGMLFHGHCSVIGQPYCPATVQWADRKVYVSYVSHSEPIESLRCHSSLKQTEV